MSGARESLRRPATPRGVRAPRAISPALLALALALLAHAPSCSRPPDASTSDSTASVREPPRADVVAARIAELRAALASAEPLAAPSDDERAQVQGLVEMAASTRGRMRDAALEEARGLGPRAVTPLAEIVADAARAPEARAAAVEMLAGLDDPRATAPIVELLESAREPWLRAHAAWQIARTSDDRHLLRLVLRLKYETDPEAVGAVAMALARWRSWAGADALAELARRPPPETAELARARLAELAASAGAADADDLLRRWQSPRAGELAQHAPSPALELAVWERLASLSEQQLRGVDDGRYALARLEPWAVPWIAAALEDRDVYVRTHAVQALERMGPRAASAGPALVRALDDPRIGPAAAEAIAAVAPRGALDALLESLEPARGFELRVAAVRALGRLGDRAALPRLWSLVESGAEDAQIVRAARRALAALGEGERVAAALVDELAGEEGDATSAELALERWLAGAAERWGGREAELWSRWRALDTTAPAAIPTPEESAARRAARADLLRGALAELAPADARAPDAAH